MSDLLIPEGLEARLRQIGDERYLDKHPFHKLLHGGELDQGQVQAWVLNRYCYQSASPRKDAALISRIHDVELRREWRRRIVDHGGDYMSLYGYNETTLKIAGDWVAPGDVIATVGDSGGQASSGLYFEIRKGTKPLNPRAWVSKQPSAQ